MKNVKFGMMKTLMINENKQDLLQNLALFQILSSQEKEQLISHSHIAQFAPHEIIIKQGEQHDALFIILEGKTTAIAKIMGYGLTDIETLGPGEFINETSFIINGPSTVTIMATTSLTCLVITR